MRGLTIICFTSEFCFRRVSFTILISSNSSSDVLQTSAKKLNNYDPTLSTNNLSATAILVLSSLLCITTLVVFIICCAVFSRRTVTPRIERPAEEMQDKFHFDVTRSLNKSKLSDQPSQKFNTIITSKGDVGIYFMYFIIYIK